jgi:hypothetical protein
MTYLDCGCSFEDDGTRIWCPDCIPHEESCYPTTGDQIDILQKRLDEMTRLATSWQNKYESLLREMRTNERHSVDVVDFNRDEEKTSPYDF